MIDKLKMIEYLTDGAKKELELIEQYKEHVRSDKKYWEWMGRRPKTLMNGRCCAYWRR